MKLNLGCGTRLLRGYVNVDLVKVEGVDLVHDLDELPWPWPGNYIDEIEARDVFEHVRNPIGFMCEAHRVLRRGRYLHMRTPNVLTNPFDAFTDPTHLRFPTPTTWDYWIKGTILYERHNAAYGGVEFASVDIHDDRGTLDVTLRKISRREVTGEAAA